MVLKQKNRNLIIGLVVALVIAVLVILLLILNKKDSKYQKMQPIQEEQPIQTIKEQPPKDKPIPSLVLFYANWCGHSQNFLDVWSQLMKQNLKCDMIGLEQEKNPKDIEVNSISGFPTIRLYPSGYIPASQDYIEYNGNRSLESLTDFVMSEGNSAY